jgi:hypothetical protein
MTIYVLLLILISFNCNVISQSVTIVIASKFEDLTWVHQRLKGYDVKIYRPDNNTTGYYSDYEKGVEACMYLSYIINYYNNLSDYTIFLHGHESSWHSKNITHLIPRLEYSKLEYANLNYNNYQHVIFDDRYNKLITSLYNKSIPDVKHYCCAQFVIKKDRILRNSLEIYQSYDYWLRNIEEENYYTSRVFEYTWHITFGNPEHGEKYKTGVCDLINCNIDEIRKNKILYTYYMNDDGFNIRSTI